jgi:very-short-patch-repair endonuclease/predicted nucleic acid-binding Zn ribbon protein
MKKNCLVCGKSLNYGINFCSVKCYGIFQRDGDFVNKECIYCHLKFTVPSYRRNSAKYCSNDCKDKFKELPKVKVNCFTCGKTLIRKKTKGFKTTKNKFCSVKCRNNRGVGSTAKFVYKHCTMCQKLLTIKECVVRRKEAKGIKTYHCSRKCLFQYQHTLRSKGPNKSERKLEKMLSGTGFKFVGNFKVCIGGKYPDFISKRKHKVIEFFGNHWHRKSDESKRIKHFQKHGYQCLIIWGHELKYNPLKVKKLLHEFTA